MCGKFTCGMLAGLAAGVAMGVAVKSMTDKKDVAKIKKKAKTLLSKVENYVNDTMPFTN